MTKRKAAWRRYYEMFWSDRKEMVEPPEPKRSRQRESKSDRFANAIHRAKILKNVAEGEENEHP